MIVSGLILKLFVGYVTKPVSKFHNHTSLTTLQFKSHTLLNMALLRLLQNHTKWSEHCKATGAKSFVLSSMPQVTMRQLTKC